MRYSKVRTQETRIPIIVGLFLGLSGALFTFGFEPYNYKVVTLLSLVFFVFLFSNKEAKGIYKYVLLWLLCHFFTNLYWINNSLISYGDIPEYASIVLVFGLSFVLALLTSIIYPLWLLFARRLWTIPFLWVLVELIISSITNFSWSEIGYIDLDIVGKFISPIFGVAGVSFVYISVATIIVIILKCIICRLVQLSLPIDDIIFSILFVIFLISVSMIPYSSIKNGKSYKIALLQGNIESFAKRDANKVNESIQIYNDLINEVLGKVDLIVLPESAIGFDSNYLSKVYQVWNERAAKFNASLLIGSVYNTEDNRYSNSVLLFNEDDINKSIHSVQRYDKINLVPFGEYLPLPFLFTPFSDFARELSNLSFVAGDDTQKTLTFKDVKVLVNICYDIIFGEQVRYLVKDDTGYLINVSNDIWFGNTSGPLQHFNIVRARALENGVPIIRVANNGVTAAINSEGEVIGKLERNTRGYLIVDIKETTSKTWFNMHGRLTNLLSWLISFLLLFIISSVVNSNQNRRKRVTKF